jgi:ribulose-5-phosphate 4-epimerase/fuculose-1-phosphate aldolase
MDDLHEGTWNHLSAKVPGSPGRILISPPSMHWSMVTASDLIEVGPEDRADIEADGGMLWVAYRIHAPIHAARPDIGAVMHAHAPHAVAISMLEGGRLEFAEQNALDFEGSVSYNEAYDGFDGFGFEAGEAMAAALGPANRVLFLRNHGVVVVGRDIAEAYTDLYILERACRTQILAMSTGRALQTVPPEIAARLGEENSDTGFKAAHFAAMRRLLDRREPDYAE